VVAISIPMCILMTFSLMHFMSIDLHQISIFGMILALGLVVDASIVVVESIESRLEAGDTLVAAISKGVGAMAWPIATATFTSIAAFLPMVDLPGIIGDFISATPVTVTFALISSLFIALCVVPLLCFAMWRRSPPVHHAKAEDRPSKFLDTYTRALKFSLRHKFLTLSLAVVAFAVSIWAIPRLGIEYFPKADKQMFLINVRLPTEANIDTTDSVARQVEDLLAQEADVRDFTANIGRGSPRVYYSEEPEDENPSYAQFVVNLKDSYGGTADAYAAKMQERLHQISGASVQTKALQQGPQAGAAVQIRVSGDDLQVLADLSRKIKERIQDVPGLVDLRDTLGDKIPRLSMKFDREKAGRLGVDTLSFARTLLMALSGETASSFRGSEEEMPLVVRVRKGTFKEVSDLTRLYVPSQTGAMVPLSEVAEIRQEQDFARIGRRDGRRSVIVQADVSGRLVNDVTLEVRERLQGPAETGGGLVDRVRRALGRAPAAAAATASALTMPLGYEMTIGGENEERDESFRAMGRAMLIGFLLIYAILALEFNSFSQPVVIMLTVPFGIVGSVFGLWVMGHPFGFMAFLGIVGQSGVVITDAIVLCDYANYLQRVEGKGMYEALILAGRGRMRPVLVTSTTDVVGLLPPLLFGGPLWAPLATAMCFGLGLSTVLSLLILPTMYAFLVRPKEGRRRQRLLARLVGR
jgi:multidrug efflux pump subunit AcrB